MAFELLVFVTWTTDNRARLIDQERANELRRLLRVLASKCSAALVELAIMETHVHTVISLGRVVDIPALAQQLKGASCRFVNQSIRGEPALRWASGYDLHSLGRRGLPAVRRYLDRQADHHSERLLVRWSAITLTETSADVGSAA